MSGELHDFKQLCNFQERWLVGRISSGGLFPRVTGFSVGRTISWSLFPRGWLSHQQFVRLLRVIRVAFGQYFHSQLLPFSREKTEVRSWILMSKQIIYQTSSAFIAFNYAFVLFI